MIKIVTDTAVNLPPEVLREHAITIVPGLIHFGKQAFVDYFEITPSQFYERLAAAPELPTTVDPTIEDFKVVYRSLLVANPTDSLLSIHCSGALAQTVESARIAASSFPDAHIRIFDTQSVSAAQGLMIWEAARMAADNAALSDILMRLFAMREGMSVYFTLDTLEFLARSGRMGRVAWLLGNLLDIKPVLTIRNGIVEPLDQPRSRPKALAALRALAIKHCQGRRGLRMAVMHAQCEQEARALADNLEAELAPEIMMLTELGAGVGAVAGPGALGVCWYAPKPETGPLGGLDS